MKLKWEDDEGRVMVSTEPGVWHEASDIEKHLREVILNLVEVEDSPCRFDHHGYCQEHGWFGEPGDCGTRFAREAVGLTT